MYTYIFLDENDEPFYVGRTAHLSRTRSFDRNADCNAEVADITENGFEPRCIVINCNTLLETLDLEMFLIKDLGRRDLGTGNLTNWSDGGEYPTEFSDATRKRMGQRARERGFGGTSHWKPDTWEKVRLSQIGNTKGLGREVSDEERQATTERNYGNQYAKGFRSTIFQEKKSEVLTGRVFTPDGKQRSLLVWQGSTNLSLRFVRDRTLLRRIAFSAGAVSRFLIRSNSAKRSDFAN